MDSVFKLTLCRCCVSECCVSFVSFDVVCKELSDGVRYIGVFVLVNEIMCVYSVFNALLTSCATVIVRAYLLQWCCLCCIILCGDLFIDVWNIACDLRTNGHHWCFLLM